MKKIFIILLSLVVALAFIPASTYSQAPQKVLFQNWTSSTCGPCASNNPGLRLWIQDHWDNLTCVAFHVNWPSPGNDPMYLYNPTQVQDWVTYFGVNSVPQGIMMGSQPYYIGSPFDWNGMSTRYNTLSSSTTACGVTVTDTRIPPDSNRAVVTLTNYTTLPSGTYFLRVMVIEHWVIYTSPPGTNGETIFENVFRKALPSSLGTYINTNAGTYTYEFRYKIDPVWKDTSIYTMAYVQNDANKSILNTARNGMYFTGITPNTNEIPNKIELGQNYPNPFNPTTNIKFDLPKDEFVTLKVYDLLGKEVRTIVEGMHKAGKYNVVVDIGDLSSGIYFYTLKTDNFIDTKKMSLLK